MPAAKRGGERAVLLVAARAQDLVQGAPRQPAARQGPVDRGDAERQHPVLRRRRPLDPPDPLAKRRQGVAFHVRVLFETRRDVKPARTPRRGHLNR